MIKCFSKFFGSTEIVCPFCGMMAKVSAKGTFFCPHCKTANWTGIR